MQRRLRAVFRQVHVWLGLITGVFTVLMGFTGGIVALRPPLASWLSPSPRVTSCKATDWDRAEREITAFAHSEINRVYGPYGNDTRYHFRMATDSPIIFQHVIYDACEGRVLGSIDYRWMDWTVDLHHNLLAGQTGRRWAGLIGILMLIGSVSGFFVWLLAKPDPRTAFRVSFPLTKRTPRELHRAFGLGAAVLLTLEALTGAGLAFPQNLRSMVSLVAPFTAEVRPPRVRGAQGERVSLGTLMAAAKAAMPDGVVREIRMPENGGNAQIRMWRMGDFRSLGNNVVFVSGVTGKVLAADRYAELPAGNRVIQGLAGLHYDEWGGLPFRLVCAAAGLATPLLFVTGLLMWFSTRRRGSSSRREHSRPAAAVLTH
jgi:uncharacterized iron-regulated membrane protein